MNKYDLIQHLLTDKMISSKYCKRTFSIVVVSLYFLQKYEDFQQNVYHIKIIKGTKIRVQRKTNKQ